MNKSDGSLEGVGFWRRSQNVDDFCWSPCWLFDNIQVGCPRLKEWSKVNGLTHFFWTVCLLWFFLFCSRVEGRNLFQNVSYIYTCSSTLKKYWQCLSVYHTKRRTFVVSLSAYQFNLAHLIYGLILAVLIDVNVILRGTRRYFYIFLWVWNKAGCYCEYANRSRLKQDQTVFYLCINNNVGC